MTDSDDRLQRVVGWALDHCAVEANLDATFVVVGDPEVLWSGPSLTPEVLGGRAWASVELPAGRVICVAGSAGED